MFAFCIVGKIESISLDFDQAFTQAEIKIDVYIEIPLGYNNPGNNNILKLKINFYSLIDRNLTWHEYCTKSLESHSFTGLSIDPCLFYKKDLILILYVDDYCIFRTSKAKINKFLESLKRLRNKKEKKQYLYKDKGFDFTVESSIEKFLRVEILQRDNIVMLRQQHLIKRIISTVGFENK